MGTSARHDSLRYSKCYKKDWIDYAVRDGDITWRNVEAIERVGDGVKCKCLNCGHEYISRSKAPFRAIRSIENDNNKNQQP